MQGWRSRWRRAKSGCAAPISFRAMPATIPVVAFAVIWSFVQDGAFTDPVRGAAIAVIGQFYDVAVVAGRVDERAFGAWWPLSMAVQCLTGWCERNAARMAVKQFGTNGRFEIGNPLARGAHCQVRKSRALADAARAHHEGEKR